MSYITGAIVISPALNGYEIAYLRRWLAAVHYASDRGPYDYTYTPPTGHSHEPHPDLPGLNNYWTLNEYGSELAWVYDGDAYDADQWLTYVIGTFLKSGAALQLERAQGGTPGHVYPMELDYFTYNHVTNGIVTAHGDAAPNLWQIKVHDNVVTRKELVETPLQPDQYPAQGSFVVTTITTHVLPAQKVWPEGYIPENATAPDVADVLRQSEIPADVPAASEYVVVTDHQGSAAPAN